MEEWPRFDAPQSMAVEGYLLPVDRYDVIHCTDLVGGGVLWWILCHFGLHLWKLLVGLTKLCIVTAISSLIKK